MQNTVIIVVYLHKFSQKITSKKPPRTAWSASSSTRTRFLESRSKNFFRLIRGLVWLFYPQITVEGIENLPDEPCIVVGNHSQMNGPICGELYFPGKRKIWCASQMMKMKEVPQYAFEDFWSRKPKWQHGFYRLLSYAIAPISSCVFNHAFTIPVYHDTSFLNWRGQ